MDFHPLYEDLFAFMKTNKLEAWLETLMPLLQHKLQEKPHGDLSRWLDAFHDLPDLSPDTVELNIAAVSALSGKPLDNATQNRLQDALLRLSPWRKGPFNIFDVFIDTEWRSDFKWERIKEHLSPLRNRVILDVGCGSGYHAWRMLGEGAQHVIGIDPSNLFLIQFEAMKKYCGPNSPIHFLPVRMEDVPIQLEAFDTTFSMGVLYHRRSPIDHLLELKGTLRQGGELVLETLVSEGAPGHSLMPKDRYAMMRNVWFIPSTDTIILWLERAGFKNIKCVEKNQTALEEQRSTDWMTYQSLKDFLDPDDMNKTIEGYPAPLRATFIATK
tara:strand:- start:49328 stop:50311 length:984 start_codon:yes stop_codon:yes gene_type:complete